MPFKFFVISVRDDGSSAEELNSFLQSHRVLSVDRKWVDQGLDSFWSICVDYHVGGTDGGSRSKRSRSKDYKDILSPEDFSHYAVLRELRKELAEKEGVPVYTIFTNEQLAQIVQAKPLSKTELKSIEGIGDARTEKYGESILTKLFELTEGEKNETGGESVSEDH